MITRFSKVTIVRIRKEPEEDLNKEIQWFSDTLGLFNERDKEKSCFRLFVELLKAAKQKRPMSSDELAFKLNLSRGTVVHHLRNLISKGIVVTEDNKYMLRKGNLKEIVKSIWQDVDTVMANLQDEAEKIDKKLKN
ncbi:MAG: ArsR family transcriptional regulator [archaeon]